MGTIVDQVGETQDCSRGRCGNDRLVYQLSVPIPEIGIVDQESRRKVHTNYLAHLPGPGHKTDRVIAVQQIAQF